MIRFTITGVAPFDGTHDLDIPEREFNLRELHIIKGLAGVRAGELDAAIDAKDSDIMLAFVVIALIRTGRIQTEKWHRVGELFLDAPAGAVQVEILETEEPEADTPVPPTLPLSDEPPSGELET